MLKKMIIFAIKSKTFHNEKRCRMLLQKNWLSDTCIYAYMKTFENKGVYVLDYIQTNKFAYEKSEKITNIFPKVITLLFVFLLHDLIIIYNYI